MNIDNIDKIAFKAMARRKSHLKREKGFVYYHGQRVAKIAMNLRKELFPQETAMDDAIYVAALFHDVAKGIEPHHATGAHLVRTLLKDECNAEEIEVIATIIASHNSRKRDEFPFYIKIVQDADILDHFGSMEIWLKFMYSAHEEENVFDSFRVWDSVEHKKYLDESRGALNYDRSKEIFDRKIQFEEQFQARFRLECDGEVVF